MSSDRPNVRRDDRYYHSSLVTFQVENCLFRVLRDAFEQSEVFHGMFAVPNVSQEGDSDDNPIHLEGIKEAAFRNFLEVLYSPAHTEKRDEWQLDQWTAVLDLAHMWEFEKIRGLAITKLQSFDIDEVSKVEMAQKYIIEEWYAPAYLALAKRYLPLTDKEATQIGLDVAVKIARVRERNMRRNFSRVLKIISRQPFGILSLSAFSLEREGEVLLDIIREAMRSNIEDQLEDLLSQDIREILS